MTYEYVCEACGHQWEAEQSIKASPLKQCVSCGVDKAKRLISGGTGFLLKGGGWYADLYGSPGSSASKGDDKNGKAAPSAKPETGTAESSAAKSESAGSKSESSSGGDTKPAASSTPSSSGTSSSSSSTSAAS